MKYKRSKFNIKLNYDSKLLLFNTASSAFCALDQEGEESFNNLDGETSKFAQSFIDNGFWVHEDENENFIQEAKRHLAIYTEKKNKHIVIAPTLSCNARCYYCYEQGRSTPTMSTETIHQLVDFLAEYCSTSESLNISWFGGEPLLCTDIISTIISLLEERLSIPITSTMTSNGSLINEEVISQMKNEWNLKHIQITIDGTEEYYNKVKNYYNGKSYFSQIISSIGSLLNNKIAVIIRINVSYENLEDSKKLLDHIYAAFGNNELLTVRFMTLVDYLDQGMDSRIIKDEADIKKVCEEMFDKMFELGYYKPDVRYLQARDVSCSAVTLDGLIIDPLGNFYKCQHFIGGCDQIVGNVLSGVIHNEVFTEWCKCSIPDKCENCAYLPICQGGCKQSDHLCIITKYMVDKFLIEIYKNNNEGGNDL